MLGLEIRFPLEFLVSGVPVSLQADRTATKQEWKERVRSASSAVLPKPHFASLGRMAVTIYNFPAEPMRGDLDNIVKLILDALCRHVYVDDRQVERIVVQKIRPGKRVCVLYAKRYLCESVGCGETRRLYQGQQ